MKHVLFTALVFALLATFTFAGAEGLIVPTPVPEATPTPVSEGTPTSSPMILPDPTGSVSSDLPNPSDYFSTMGIETQEAFVTFGETVYDAQLFPITNVGNALSDFLKACIERGYKWDISDDISNYESYRIYGYGYTAYLIPRYGNKILLMFQQGMPVDPVKPEPEPYEKNKLMMNVNGVVFQTDLLKDVFAYPYTIVGEKIILQDSFFENNAFKGKSLVFYRESAPYQLVLLNIPDFARTGNEYVMKKEDFNSLTFGLVENLKFKLDEEALTYLYRGGQEIESKDAVVIVGENNRGVSINVGLNSADDYLKLQLVYMDENECKGHFEGSFNKGATKVSGTFWEAK